MKLFSRASTWPELAEDPMISLVEHQRYSLFSGWPGGETSQVDPYAYAFWDE